jgi:glyoxylase-like metal-dependent hydrolase (beta-lactamase superfamily II)
MRAIADGVYSVGQKKGGRVHAYLFDNGGELTLVDTLFDTDARLVLGVIEEIRRTPKDLKHILLTHAHRSHLGGLAKLRELSGALVYAHEWETDIIAGERAQQPVSLVPRGPMSTYYLRLGLALGRPRHPPCPVDRLLTEGDTVGPLQVIHIPGHTPGHMAFYDEGRDVLAVGDAVATWPKTGAGWPGFNLNEGLYRLSFQKLAKFEAKVVAVGHGEPLIGGGAADTVHELAEQLRG